MKKSSFILVFIVIVIFIFRLNSSINENQAREIALDIISEKHSNSSCGGNFEKYLSLDNENPLGVKGLFGIDKSGYTFTSDNGRCTVIIYVYKYWGGYEYAIGPN